MSKRKGIIYAALQRLHAMMALKESRYEAKKARRAAGERVWSFTTERIHSLTTRGVYQQHILAFVNWARDTYHVTHLEQLDERADELVTAYLTHHIAAGRSPYTLQTERAALRMFFHNRSLAATVTLPARKREQIRRSRGPVAQDKEFQPLNWQREIRFLRASGLRRAEARALLVGDVQRYADGHVEIRVIRGKGGRARAVPVLPGREQDVLSVVAGRRQEEQALGRLPIRMDIHGLRREYAQALYLHYAPGRKLPSSTGRLKHEDYDSEAAMKVSVALGHLRLQIVLTHYLR